jgi:hypothetical protein
MAVTLGALKTRILYETNNTSADFDTGVTNAIITAIKFMEMTHPWVFTKTGVITILEGKNSVSLPADFNQLLDAKYTIPNDPITNPGGSPVLYGTRQGFTIMSFADLNSKIWSTAEAGYPCRYAVYGAVLYVYPYVSANVPITIDYNYKDAFYPATDNDTSVWFDDQTVDVVRNKALEIFYRDTLQSPEISNSYVPVFENYSNALKSKNNKRLIYNTLSV